MAMLIEDGCIACNACYVECPNEAITPGDIYVIDPYKCTECKGWYDEPQCVAACPVDCIVPDPAWRETEEQLLAKRIKNISLGVKGVKGAA